MWYNTYMSHGLQLGFALSCPACGSVVMNSIGGHPDHVEAEVLCQIAICKECNTQYITPGIFTGMRCVAPDAADLLRFWDKTTEDFATLWTFYHNKSVPGYEVAYEDLP